MAMRETSGSAILGKGRHVGRISFPARAGTVVVTQRRGEVGTFGWFIFPIDLGVEFRYRGVLHKVVHLPDQGRYTIGALCLEGPEVNSVHRLTNSVEITDVNSPHYPAIYPEQS